VVDVDGVRPRALDAISGDNVVGCVLEGAVLAFDVGVYQPEFAAVMCKARCPYA
jgi:hypothetical protein